MCAEPRMVHQRDLPKDSWSRESKRAERWAGRTAAATAVKLESSWWAPMLAVRTACGWVGSSAVTMAGQMGVQLVDYWAVWMAGYLVAKKAACWAV